MCSSLLGESMPVPFPYNPATTRSRRNHTEWTARALSVVLLYTNKAIEDIMETTYSCLPVLGSEFIALDSCVEFHSSCFHVWKYIYA